MEYYSLNDDSKFIFMLTFANVIDQASDVKASSTFNI